MRRLGSPGFLPLAEIAAEVSVMLRSLLFDMAILWV
jgi:hypothetical protein